MTLWSLNLELDLKLDMSLQIPGGNRVKIWQNLKVSHFDLANPQGQVMSEKYGQPLKELTVQVGLLYGHWNFQYSTIVSGTEGSLRIKRASPVFWSFVQLTNLNQSLHLLSRENIIFAWIRDVYMYGILFNEIFMSFIVFYYKSI